MSDTQHAKHRSAPVRARQTRSGRLRALTIGGVAVLATGLAVGGGLVSSSVPGHDTAAALSASPATTQLTEADLAQREAAVSRSEDRTPLAAPVKARALSNASGPARTRSADLTSADPRTLTKALMPQFGMSPSDFSCIDAIWSQESGWDIHATNPTSGAYGIPQALPASKMASAGPDYQNNAATQIKWGLGYIKGRYGSPCAAAGFKAANGWY